VKEIRRKLGAFEYGTDTTALGRREQRAMASLENGARYEGEWLVGTNIRQGKGI